MADAKAGPTGPDLEDSKTRELTTDVFKQLSKYIRAEVAASTHDYQLLGKLNMMMAEKYKNMQEKAVKMNEFLKGLDEKHKKLIPYLRQIDQLHDNVAKLERVVLRLDQYTQHLEQQFKNVYKK